MDEVKGNIYLVTERNKGLVYQTSTRLAFYPPEYLKLTAVIRSLLCSITAVRGFRFENSTFKCSES